MDVICNDVDTLVDRLQLPALYQQLWESLFSALRTPSAENISRLHQCHVAAENAFNAAISTAYQTLPIGSINVFVTTMYPSSVLIDESRRYLCVSPTPMMDSSYPPTSKETEAQKKGFDGSDREGGDGDDVIIVAAEAAWREAVVAKAITMNLVATLTLPLTSAL